VLLDAWALKNPENVVAPQPKYFLLYDALMKKRWPGEFPERASAGLLGSPAIALPVHEPDAMDPGSTQFWAFP